MIKQELKSLLSSILNQNEILDGASEEAAIYLKEPRGKINSYTDYIVFPRTTESISNIVKLCNEYNIKIIPQSGNTGLTGGCVANNNSIIINSKNLNNILEINPQNYTISVQAGCVLADIHKALSEYNLLFPLSLASEHDCKIGGNIAGNAGGLSALKYGCAGDLVLGLELVLPNGEIFSDLNILRKRNIGPQIKNLFIASEGILGYLTAVTLKLVPKPVKQLHVIIGVDKIEKCKKIFDMLYNKFYQQISSFEIFNNNSVSIVKYAYPNINYPLSANTCWNILASFDFLDNDPLLEQYLENKIKNILQQANVLEYLMSYKDKIWEVRKQIPSSQTIFGYSLKHDIAVPLDNIVKFVKETSEKLEKKYPCILYPIIFGHMGDGNLHYNISLLKTNQISKNIDLKSYEKEIKDLIVEIAIKMRGTFSAEHGIGLINKNYLEQYCNKTQMNLLKLLKTSLDKNNIFNNNKVVNI